MEISAQSTESILVPVAEQQNGQPIDTSSFPVQMALLPDTVQPKTADWMTAFWETNILSGIHNATIIVGPSSGTVTLVAGRSYRPWVRVFAPTETPVLRSPGMVRVY